MCGQVQINFYLTRRPIKEVKKKYCKDNIFYVVDVDKIISDLGYNLSNLTPESEFVIDYSIRKKISQGIRSTRSNEVLIVYGGIKEDFIGNLEDFLYEESKEVEFIFNISWLSDKY